MTQAQQRHAPQRSDDAPRATGDGSTARERLRKASDTTADLLDEIDDVLNELPQDLAETFKQLGGQ